MIKAFAIYLFATIILGYAGYCRISYLMKENNNLKKQVEMYHGKMEANNRAEKTIGEIRTITKTVKSVCDCYNSRVDDSIINILRHRNTSSKAKK